jgi:hypothetical protein
MPTRRTVLGGVAVASTVGCLDGSGDSPTPAETADDLHVENRDISAHEIAVELASDAADEPLVADTFALPATTAITFDDAADSGTYTVTAEIDDGRTLSAEWTVTDCEDGEGSGGNRDGAVQVTTEAFRFRQNACDATFVGTAGIPYENPDDYRV